MYPVSVVAWAVIYLTKHAFGELHHLIVSTEAAGGGKTMLWEEAGIDSAAVEGARAHGADDDDDGPPQCGCQWH